MKLELRTSEDNNKELSKQVMYQKQTIDESTKQIQSLTVEITEAAAHKSSNESSIHTMNLANNESSVDFLNMF